MLRKRSRSVQKDQNQMGHHNQQQNSDSGSESFSHNKNPKNSPFYTSIPGLLVGLSPKGLALSDCDSVRSPTSPLDFRLFSGLGSPFRPSTTKFSSFSSFCHENGQQRSWGSKLGLISIIDSLDDNGDLKFSGQVLRSSLPSPSSSSSSSSSSESGKNILFGPMLRRINKPTNENGTTKSLPKNYAIFPHSSKPKSPLQKGSSYVHFEIGDIPSEESDPFGKIRSCSLDSCRTISNLSGLRTNLNNNPNSSPKNLSLEDNNNITVTAQVGSNGNGFIGSLSAAEIELSEDYTCVISHGPNPKTTHIFGDCILETHSNDLSNFGKSLDNNNPMIMTTITSTTSETCVQYPSDDFLSFCYSCNKRLEEGKDIYIYRGEKAFCSLNCRSVEILIDEELEKSSDKELDDHDVDVGTDEDDCKELFFETGLIS